MIEVKELNKLKETAFNSRKSCLKIANNGGCFLGASLSCIDIIVYLYGRFLRHDPSLIDNRDRDYFFLSKGHDVPALYSVLVENGYMKKERLSYHLKNNDYLYWHPNTNIPAVEFHSGSLGHLPSVSLGVAIDISKRNSDSKVITIVGDGELNEGSVWESILVANSLKLPHFCIIVDRNKFQANGRTEEIIPLEPLADKFSSFGCEVYNINGHSFEEMDQCFNQIDFSNGSMKVVICDTVRGKGIPSIEGKADKWFCTLDNKMYAELNKELETGEKSSVVIPSTCVR